LISAVFSVQEKAAGSANKQVGSRYWVQA
jgi:hypothetical protein